MDGYERLASAIIAKAMDEYVKYHKKIKQLKNKVYKANPYNYSLVLKKQQQDKETIKKLKEEIEELEEFFYSDWFSTLSHGKDPDSILDKLKEAIDDN